MNSAMAGPVIFTILMFCVILSLSPIIADYAERFVIEIGQTWSYRKNDGDPWNGTEIHRVKIIDIKDGWVKYQWETEYGTNVLTKTIGAFCIVYDKEVQ